MTIAEKNIEIVIAVKIKKRPAKTVASEGAKGLPGKVACQRFGEATFELNPERRVDPRKTAALTASFRGIAICVDETISLEAQPVRGALPVESAILSVFAATVPNDLAAAGKAVLTRFTFVSGATERFLTDFFVANLRRWTAVISPTARLTKPGHATLSQRTVIVSLTTRSTDPNCVITELAISTGARIPAVALMADFLCRTLAATRPCVRHRCCIDEAPGAPIGAWVGLWAGSEAEA